ncbi:hypothetical protein BON22_2121 [Cyberlindnera fabianii]|uniref:Fe2OG dioxygenase domain-containing protein n=1 Tax=Cyberlindnera fabianii TaxID=36022 RepID=A0A1V2L9T2_CYBFA|nr:hypothetical protein BON22_2121 [Cyberlindnera fabianii]
MPAPIFTEKALSDDVLNDNLNYMPSDEVWEQSVKPLLQEFLDMGIDPNTKFDPDRHILFTDDYFAKTQRKTLAQLGCKETHQEPISEIGVSEPFPLFTDECIALMRWEVFQEQTFKKWARLSSTSTTGDKDLYMRGYALEESSFTKDAWTHPRVQAIVDQMSGVHLVPQFDYEIGNINISLRQPDTTILGVNSDKNQAPKEMPGIVSWHYDSPQFVCVLMLSDTTNMIGGETALATGDGRVVRAEGPKRGWATILQGRVLKHIATKPRGNFTERITSVTSYRPKDVMLDNSPLTTVKPSVLTGSLYNEFYKDYMNYRLDVLAERVEILRKKINDDITKGNKFDQLETIEFFKQKVNAYVEQTWQEFEVVDDGLVERPANYNIVRATWD